MLGSIETCLTDVCGSISICLGLGLGLGLRSRSALAVSTQLQSHTNRDEFLTFRPLVLNDAFETSSRAMANSPVPMCPAATEGSCHPRPTS
jgi:hypothetical protein